MTKILRKEVNNDMQYCTLTIPEQMQQFVQNQFLYT